MQTQKGRRNQYEAQVGVALSTLASLVLLGLSFSTYRLCGPLIVVTILGGCASIVYKDAATTYVAAGRGLSQQLINSASNLSAAEDALKLSKIISDSSCPVADERLFIRSTAPRASDFKTLLAPFPNLEPSCQKLRQCDAIGATDASCQTVCMSREESNCIVQLEQDYAISLNPQATIPSANTALTKNANALANRMQRMEYGRAVPIENRLVTTSLDALTQYLDLLAKITEKRKSELPADAKKLSDRLTNAIDGIEKATNTQLSSTADRQKALNAVTALGTMLGDIKVMVQNAKDADEIKKLVNANQVDIEAVIASIKPVINGDTWLGMQVSDSATIRFRKDIQERFKNAHNSFERKAMMDERAKYQFSNAKQIQDSVTKVFDSLSSSHKLLVSLINNPNDDQIKAIRNEEFESLKTLIGDVSGVVAAAK